MNALQEVNSPYIDNIRVEYNLLFYINMATGKLVKIDSTDYSLLTAQSGSTTISNDQIVFDGSVYYTFTTQALQNKWSFAMQYTQTLVNPEVGGFNMILSQDYSYGKSLVFGYFFNTPGISPQYTGHGYYVGIWNGSFNLVGPIPIQYNVPTDIVVTFDTGTLNVYLNGSLTNSLDSLPVIPLETMYYLGLASHGFASSPSYHIGSMKYLYMYKHVLTTTAINYLARIIPPITICFLHDAPVLTPEGYRPIGSLKKGDHVMTPEGKSVPIEKVAIRYTEPNPSTNPYVIPKGSHGALEALPISPDHKVLVDGKMVEAKHLGLTKMMMVFPFEYYNLELPDYEQMIVAGVTVESLYPIMRIPISGDEFKQLIHNKYGPLVTREQLEMINKKVRYLSDGRIEVPVDKRLHLSAVKTNSETGTKENTTQNPLF
jgi:hypothetical protein